MKYDKPLYAILIGMLAVFPYEGFTQITEQLGWNNGCVFDANSMIFSETPSRLVGALTTPLTGGLVAIVIYYMTKFTDTDYLWLKGAFVGAFTWAIIQGILKISATSYLKQSPSGNLVYALGAALTGALIGFLIKKFLLDMLFERPYNSAYFDSKPKSKAEVLKPRQFFGQLALSYRHL